MDFRSGGLKKTSLTCLFLFFSSSFPHLSSLLPLQPSSIRPAVKMQALSFLFTIAAGISFAAAQTHQRLGGCPDLGCVFPPDQYVSRITAAIPTTLDCQTNKTSCTSTLGLTSLPVNSSISVLRFTLRSMALRLVLANPTPTSPSLSPRRVTRVSQLRNSSIKMSQSWSDGTSAGTRVRIFPSVVFDQISNKNRPIR